MSFFEYPHTRTYDSDLGWIIKNLLEMRTDLGNFINLNTIKYADPIEWNITKQYEGNTVVINGLDGTAYISTKPVPAGVNITNTDYWTPIFNYGDSIRNIQDQIADANEENSPTATAAYSQGDVIWWNNELYRILYDIAAGTAFIPGTNVEPVTIDGLIAEKADISYVNKQINYYGVTISPEKFDGSDYQKLQAAVNYAIDHNYGTVVIAREYDITGHSIKINKGLYHADTNFRKKLTFLGIGEGMIYKGDAGYIFTGDKVDTQTDFAAGDLSFINMSFAGARTVVRPSDNWSGYCSVFDCSRLIRITSFGCSFFGVGNAYDGTQSTSTTRNMQCIYTYGDTCTYSHAYMRLGYAWVITVQGAVIESCNYGFYDDGATTLVTELHITESTLETCYKRAITISPTNQLSGGVANLSVQNCYFESNGTYSGGNVTYDIYLHSRYMYNVFIEGNHFSPYPNGHCIDILIRNKALSITENDCSNNASGAVLIYAEVDNNTVGANPRFYGNNYVASISLTNMPGMFKNIDLDALTTYNGLADNSLPANLDNYTAERKFIGNVKTSDNATNTPHGETAGQFISAADGIGNVIQFFKGSVDGILWQRTRAAGVGWGTWKPCGGVYSFKAQGLSGSGTITLPYPSDTYTCVTMDLIYTTGTAARYTAPAVTLAPNATTFNYNILNPAGGNVTETDMQAVVTVTPYLIPGSY